MKLATKTRYGVRLMVDLAEHANCGIVPLKDVAARQGISKKYLGQVATPLVTAGLVHVERGVNGGYQLARDPRNITIADIVHATEDGFGLIECTSKANLAAIPSCPRIDTCAARLLWGGLETAIESYLAGVTLEELANQASYQLTTMLTNEEGSKALPSS